MNLRQLQALGMGFSLAWNSAPARPTVLGVVVEASRVHLNTGTVSAGATVYDGDHFSTETGGVLRLRADATMLDLAEESVVILRSKEDGARGTEAQLDKGTLAFSAARPSALEIAALEARVRPITDARTVAQVSVTGPKELRIYARRGSLQFSYRGETETIVEGECYRVILDPPPHDPQRKEAVKPGRQRKAFLFLVVGIAATGVALLLYENHGSKPLESPDRP